MKKALLIVNPVSGKMKIRSVLMDLCNRLEAAGYETSVAVTQRRGHAAEIVTKRGQDKDLILCCGGDGTLNETASGMVNAKLSVPCGYLPMGSTNDFAACVGLPTEPMAALECILAGEPKPIDLGRFNEQDNFCYIASFGAFTSASYSTPQASKNLFGHLAYVPEGVKDVFNTPEISLTCDANDLHVEGSFCFGAVMNSTSIGGFVKLDKKLVDMSDGKFECILVKKPKNIIELNRVVNALNSSNFEDDLFVFFRTDKVSFVFEEELDWSLDGEHHVSPRQLTVENLFHALPLVR